MDHEGEKPAVAQGAVAQGSVEPDNKSHASDTASDRRAETNAAEPSTTSPSTTNTATSASTQALPQVAAAAPSGQAEKKASGQQAASDAAPAPEPRWVVLPMILLAATCLSIFFVGMTGCDFLGFFSAPGKMLREKWWQGAAYMLSVMGIWLTHEMGHLLQAVRYGVPAGLPWFIPLPFSPLGTLGAVIASYDSESDRKQLFDIGLTGPLAGLAVALPLTCLGLIMATPKPASIDATLGMRFGEPLLLKILIACLRPDVPEELRLIVHSNPMLFAGWVGMLVTGMNMLAIGQLDGGHVAYALMGKRSRWLGRTLVLASVVFVVVTRDYSWSAMLLLILIMGTYHPPTANDDVELGRGRTVLGWLSLTIPLFCMPPFPTVPS